MKRCTWNLSAAAATPCVSDSSGCAFLSPTQDITGKAVGIFLPISAFVSSGYEHSVANMFGVPMGIALGAPFNFWHFVAKNLVPVTIGGLCHGYHVDGSPGNWPCFRPTCIYTSNCFVPNPACQWHCTEGTATTCHAGQQQPYKLQGR